MAVTHQQRATRVRRVGTVTVGSLRLDVSGRCDVAEVADTHGEPAAEILLRTGRFSAEGQHVPFTLVYLLEQPK